MRFAILSPMELYTVSNISAIWAGIYSTLLVSKYAISWCISASMYLLRRSIVMFCARCDQKA